jgi:hypothetical protein
MKPSALSMLLATWLMSSQALKVHGQGAPIKLASVAGTVDEVVCENPKTDNTKPFLSGKRTPPPAGRKYVRVTASVIYSRGMELTIEPQDVRLVDGTTALKPIGHWPYYGIFWEPWSIHLMRSPDDPRTAPLQFNCVFEAPAEQKQFIFEVNGTRAPVEVRSAPEKVNMSTKVAFSVQAAKLVDTLPMDQAGFTSENGKLLVLTCTWKPKSLNEMTTAQSGYELWDSWLNVVDNSGLQAPCVGCFPGTLEKPGLRNIKLGKAKTSIVTAVGGTNTYTFVFPVPATLKQFDVTLNGWPLAKGTVKGR